MSRPGGELIGPGPPLVMNLNKSTRYAIEAAVELTLATAEPVSVGQVAERFGIPEGALAKVFQQLVRAGIAVGIRGVGGGYRLAKPPSEITVADIIEAFEGHRAESRRLFAGTRGDHGRGEQAARVRRLFDEVDELLHGTLASVSLETLVRGPALRRRASDPAIGPDRASPLQKPDAAITESSPGRHP